jgi:hypothetical protein
MKKLFLLFGLVLGMFCLLQFVSPSAFAGGPSLFYCSAKAGPNQGWEGSATKGAAITIWAKNVGTSRGSNTLTVAGVTLTNNSDYAEWGATTNPTTAKGLQRISFWLNSSMTNGNAAGIYVTVGGVNSNTLPFTIDNTASGRIRFIDQVNGNDSWDGKYKDHTLGGNHGPWAIPFTNVARDGYLPGAFIYMRAGTYKSIMIYGCHAPWGGCVGACEGSSSGCYCYETPYGGTDALRMTLTSYPGELAHLFNVSLGFDSDYWTVANLKWDGDLSHQNDSQGNVYVALQMGFENNCVNCPYRNTGEQVIGNEFTGNIHCALHTFSDNCNILGNYFSTYPTLAGMGIDQSDPMYISSGNNILVQNNEIHGGSNWAMQLFDENRCGSSGNEIPKSRGYNNVVIDSNLLDINRSTVTPYQKAGALVLGIYSPTGFMNNVTVKNNVMTNTDGLISQAGIKLDLEAGPTASGIYIYNNTVDLGSSSGISFIYIAWATATYGTVEVKNNILTHVNGYHFNSQGMAITPVWDYNLTDKALSLVGSVTNGGHNLVGNPLYVAPASRDYHLQSSSPARDVGVKLSSVATDYDGVSRPQGSGYDIGAYEYTQGGYTQGDTTAPVFPKNPRVLVP